VDNYFAHQEKRRLETVPHLHGKPFAGRILSANYVVEVAIIQLIEDRRKY
jgi:hypothetical protein